MRDRIVAKGVPADRVHLIGVWSDQEEIGSTDREANGYRVEWGTEERLLVMYSGNFGIGHDVDTFLGAARVLRDDDRIRFAFVGGGKRKSVVEAWIAEHDLGATCTSAPYQPRERLGELLTAADVHLASMLPGWEGVMVPSKLFGVLAAGRPVLFVGPSSSEVALVVEERDCGHRVDPGDIDSLVERIRAYADDDDRVRLAGQRAFEALRDEHGAVHRLEQWRSLIESFGPDSGHAS
jgi:colanic acid biosynthesis glycosyl transferase WcaI